MSLLDGVAWEKENPPKRINCLVHKRFNVVYCPDCSAMTRLTKEAVDVVKSPSHYQFFPGVEAIEIIAASMSEEGFHGYCMGNRLKYRLRAGNKDKLEQDISKSDFYVELFNKHKHLCKAAK